MATIRPQAQQHNIDESPGVSPLLLASGHHKSVLQTCVHGKDRACVSCWDNTSKASPFPLVDVTVDRACVCCVVLVGACVEGT